MKKEGADRRPLFCTTGEYYGKRAPTEELYAFLRENSCDAILCTHVFSAMQLTHLLQVHPMDVRTFFVATDYTCSPGCGRSRLDKYFIPNAALAEDFIAGGVPAQKLIPSGIPVRQTFCQSHDKGVAKMRQGIEPSQRHLLIMCGSMGCGPMAEIAVMLSQNMPENFRISVVCGRNKTLRRKLTKALTQDESVFVRGYVKDMASLMDSADLYLTKPGGVSVSEAAEKGLPMVFVNAVAGCESYNLRFFEALGAAVSGKTPRQLADLCLRILPDERKLEQMSGALRVAHTHNAAKTMYACMTEELTHDETTTCR